MLAVTGNKEFTIIWWPITSANVIQRQYSLHIEDFRNPPFTFTLQALMINNHRYYNIIRSNTVYSIYETT